MSDGDDRAGVLVQMLFEPIYAFGVKVVRGLVKEEHVGLLQQQATECHTSAFTPGEMGCRLVGRRTSQGCHGTVKAAVECPCVICVEHILQFALPGEKFIHPVLVFVILRKAELLVDFFILGKGVDDGLHTLLDNLTDCLCFIELRLLRKIAYAVSWSEYDFALIVFVQSGDDFHQRRLTRAVQADDADFRTVKEREIDIL